jgi:metal-responsive CopG/Arc/MetJ family transcriptional regulator
MRAVTCDECGNVVSEDNEDNVKRKYVHMTAYLGNDTTVETDVCFECLIVEGKTKQIIESFEEEE